MPREAGPTRRVVVVGKAGTFRTDSAIARGVRQLGHACRLVGVPAWRRALGPLAGAAIRRRVDAFAPDTLILTRYAADLDDATLAALGRNRRVFVWFFDLVERPHDRIVRLARAAEAMYVTCPGQAGLYREAGVPVLFLPQGVDPAVDRPAIASPPRYRCEVSFVGSGGYRYRHEILRSVARSHDLQIRGPGWDGASDLPTRGGVVRGRELARVIRGARVSLGAHAVPTQRRERACASNRMWKVMGCGGFYLGPRVADIERFARDGVHCAWYDTATDALERIRHYLDDPGARKLVARAGRLHALAEHSYAQRLALLLEGRAYPL